MQKVVKRGLRQFQLDLIQCVKRIAEVHQHQVALVPENRVQRGAGDAGASSFEVFEDGKGAG